jgi:hypothetical protein
MTEAKVVFPTPGGPHKIMLGILPASMARLSGAFSPNKAFCPM